MSEHLRYRNVLVDAMDALRDLSVQAERLYLRCATGRHSTRIGVVTARVSDLAAECRLRHVEVDRALDELVAAGLILRSVSGALYLVGHCRELAPSSPSTKSSWKSEILRVCSGNRSDLASQVLEELEGRKGSAKAVPERRPGSGQALPDLQEKEREKDQDPLLSPPAPAPAAPEPIPAAEPASQPDPDPVPVLPLALEPPAPKPKPPDLIALYNELCPSLSRCFGKPAAVKAAAAAWRREPDLDAWAARFRRAEASPCCTGHNDRGWRADFLWLLNPTNAEKVDLGRYDARAPPPTARPATPDAYRRIC